MSGQRIKMTIDGFGKPTIEAEGFTGASCTEATKGIEAALGAFDPQRNLKSEFYQHEEAAVEKVYEGGY